RLSRAARRRLQHRRRVLRLQPRAHPPDRGAGQTPQEVALPSGAQVLADLPLAIDPDEVLRFQGYKKGVDLPTPDVRALFDEALAEGTRLMLPRAVVRWLPVDARGPDTLEAGGEVLTIPATGERWGEVEHVAAAVVTIGEALERRVAALWESRELPLASMLDSVGSGAVESLAEYLNDVLCQQGLAAGLRVTNRISPGYAAWDVAEQHALFRLCPGAPVGVRLNTACFRAAAILPAAGVGERWRVPRRVVVLAVYIVVAGVFALMGRLLWPALSEQWTQFMEQLPKLLENVRAWLGNIDYWLGQWGAALPSPKGEKADFLAGIVLGNAVRLTTGAVGAAFELLAVLVVAAYLVIDAREIGDTLLTLLPP